MQKTDEDKITFDKSFLLLKNFFFLVGFICLFILVYHPNSFWLSLFVT